MNNLTLLNWFYNAFNEGGNFNKKKNIIVDLRGKEI